MARRGWLVAVVVLGAGLAAPAALPMALLHGKGDFSTLGWLSGFLCAWLAAVGLYVSTSGVTWRRTPDWCRGVAALSLAALAPLAATSSQHHVQADLALLAAVSVVTLSLAGESRMARAGVVWMTAVACGLEATALILPLGWFWAGIRSKTGSNQVWTMVFGGLAGLVVGRLVGLPMLSGYHIQPAAYAIHRDLVVLLVVLVLGLAGYAAARFPRGTSQPDWWLPGWAAVSTCALLVCVLGEPVNVRLCVLGLWWLMPQGLTDLAALLAGRRPNDRPARVAGLLVALAVMALALPGLLAWKNAMLLAMYLMVG